MSTESRTSDSAVPPHAESVVAQDVGARKRVELGLSPRRPTAKALPQRPPRQNDFPAPPAALPALLSMIVLATVFLVLANMWDLFPSWWHAPRYCGGLGALRNVLGDDADRGPGADHGTVCCWLTAGKAETSLFRGRPARPMLGRNRRFNLSHGSLTEPHRGACWAWKTQRAPCASRHMHWRPHALGLRRWLIAMSTPAISICFW